MVTLTRTLRPSYIPYLLLAFLPMIASSQNIITTFAGANWIYPQGTLSALNAPLGPVSALGRASNGDLLVADEANAIVLRITASGVATILAGNGISGYSGDGGPATSASLGAPQAVAADSLGNIYVADGCTIRQISPTGTISTLVGCGTSHGSFIALALDHSGNLFAAAPQAIYKVKADGSLTIYAGTGNGCGGSTPGPCPPVPANTPALSAQFGFVGALALDQAGNLYIADTMLGLYELSTAGIVNPIGSNILASALAIDTSGALYAVNLYGGNNVQVITPSSAVTVAGNGTRNYSGDGGPALSAGLQAPTAIAVGQNGTIFVGDGSRVRAFTLGGDINAFAGNGKFHSSGDGGPAASASIYDPTSTAIDTAGNIYIGEGSGWIRKVAPNGIITTIAGNGTSSASGDGSPALNAGIGQPTALTADSMGDIYFIDGLNGKIRKIDTNGIISSVTLVVPVTPPVGIYNGIAADGAGNVFISENLLCDIYRITPAGTQSIIAGNGTCGYNGDNIPATQAELFFPFGLAVDAAGNLYVADLYNSRVRKISAAGTITTLASTPADVSFVAINSSGSLFAASSDTVFQIANGSATVYAGGGGAIPGDGGFATSARLYVNQIAVDAAGNLFIADTAAATYEGLRNYGLREVLATAPQLTVTPAQFQFQAVQGGPVTAPQTLNVTGLAGLQLGVDANVPWISFSPSQVSSPAAIEITANPAGLAPGNYSANVPISAPGATVATNSISIQFSIIAATPPQLSVSGGLSFIVAENSAPETQTISISNTGGGSINCTAVADGASWLSVASPFILTANTSFPLQVTINPVGVLPGVYYANVVVSSSDGSQTFKVPITLTVTPVAGSPSGPSLIVSQTGLTFTAVVGGGSAPSQTVWVVANGGGAVNWQATAQTGVGNGGSGNWLSITPDQGVVAPGSAPTAAPITVSVNATGLATGLYEGQITISTPGQKAAAIVTVVLNVLPTGSTPPPVISPLGLVFAASAGSNAGSQQITISNLSSRTISYVSGSTPEGESWFIDLPDRASISPGQQQIVTVQTNVTSASPGVSQGAITFLFDDGSVQTASLLLVNGSPANTSTSALRPAASGSCTPTTLLGEFTSLQNGSIVTSGQPVTIGASIVDDCGTLLNSGSVSAQFSDAEAALRLNPVGNGYWEATWIPAPNSAPVTIQLTGGGASPIASVTVSSTQSSSPVPVIARGGIVSAADPLPGGPVAQGGLIAIYGSGLAATTALAGAVPLPLTVDHVQVLLSGQPIPLLYVSPSQIDAVVPYGAPVGEPLTMQVTNGTWQSLPQTVVVAAAQPAIFLLTQFGAAQAAAIGPAGLADSKTPAKAGDTISIYCEGLGPVVPAFAAGNLAPLGQLYKTAGPVSVSIGGENTVVQFAGLAPGSVGEYQVNAIIPGGVTTGDAVPVVISIGTATSPTATIAVK
jgi:uncharacterized protein (TIGR03437 family)